MARAGHRGDDNPTATARGSHTLLTRILDAEQSAAARQLALYKRKAAAVKALVARYDAEAADAIGVAGNSANQSHTRLQSAAQARRADLFAQSRQRARRQQHQRASDQLFSDWLELQGPYYPSADRRSPPQQDQTSADGGDAGSAGRFRVDLFSFRPIASIGAKKNAHHQRGGAVHPAREASPPLHQFLALLDVETGRLDLLHPLTKQVVWQHRLWPSPPSSARVSPVADYFFVSERKSFLGVLRENGEVSLFKLRVLHNRRLLSGDHRHSSRSDRAVCASASREASSVVSGALRATPVRTPPWTVAARTTAPAANHLHLDFELVFRADASSGRSQAHHRGHATKVAVVSLYSNAYVLVSTLGDELWFFNAENGALIKTVAAGEAPRRVTHFKTLASGVVALATGSRIRFANAAEQSVVPGVSCDAGAMDTITSVDSDPWHHSVLYAGTSSGRGLVFRLLNFDRARRPSDVDVVGSAEMRHDLEQPACVLVGQVRPQTARVSALLPPTRPSHAFVRAMPGYLIMATGAQVVLFETSAEGVESLLPQPVSSLDLGWMRAPAMLLCAVAVMYLQQRGANSDNNNYGRAGEFDLNAFARMAAARGQLHPYQRHRR
ncbi:hypothetical protein PybrP1_002663 [[Pythium] brassicae (nom. inval.)]|nr:hypothetical protein PybrP1_002663 [[Pythium] brassicae (nom. inval.)]